MTEQQIFDMIKVIDAEAEKLRKSGQLSGQPNASDNTEAQKHTDLKYAALREAIYALYDLADFYDGSISNNEVQR